jgi:hypothetical protein
MTINSVSTFTATVYVGFKHRYNGEIARRDAAVAAIQAYVDAVGLCVTVTDTQFVYSNGGEPGIAVGLINYPRFPSTPAAIKAHALAIAGMLMDCCRQMKVSVVMPTETVMLAAEVRDERSTD